MRWRYNTKLGRWYHPTSAVSENGPGDPPAEIEGSARKSPPVAREPVDVMECAGCEAESRRRRARREASLPADIRHPLSDLG